MSMRRSLTIDARSLHPSRLALRRNLAPTAAQRLRSRSVINPLERSIGTDRNAMGNKGYNAIEPNDQAAFRAIQVAMIEWSLEQTRRDWAHLGIDGMGGVQQQCRRSHGAQ